MTRCDDVAARWVACGLGSEKRPLRGSNVLMDGDRIFSYGRHFEIGRFLRDRKNNPTAILLNGDTFSVSTSRHQSAVRSAAGASKLPVVILPHGALGSAGIDLDTVEIVDVSADRNERTEHHSTERPPGSRWVDEHAMLPLSEVEVAERLAKKNAEALEEWERYHQWAKEKEENSWWTRWAAEHPEPPTPLDRLSDYEMTRYGPTGERHLAVGGHEVSIDTDEEGVTHYEWTTYRHHLGESLVRGTVRWTGVTPCRACARTGRDSGFHGPFTEDHDNDVYARQPRCPVCHGRGQRTWTKSRRALFLSGFDMQESTPLYFFCELPKGATPTTVAEAYEVLKPGAVVLAEEMGRAIVRQGDIFAISVHADKRTLRKRGARFEKRGNLLGTNHEASEVAYLPDGTTLVRGTLYHNPDFRRPDHARRTLGDRRSFFVVAKNTVPISA